MKLLKDQSAWKRWMKSEGLASQAFTTSPPSEYPCYAYCTVHSFGYEEQNANYLYEKDIFKMNENIVRKEIQNDQSLEEVKR